MEKISCIIVEDKQVDTDYLKTFIQQYSMLLDLKARFANALEANPYIKQYQPQLLFMDIDMPVINGMDFFKQLQPQPICIFVTAHSEYAWEGFEAQAFDFILKPVTAERFAASMARLQEYTSLLKRADIYDSQIEEHTIVVKEGTVKHVINISDILYIEALKDYSKVVTADKKIMTLSKLKHFIEKLPAAQFTRIHRSYAVAVSKVKKVEANDLFVKDIKLPIGKTFRNNLKMMI
jgi:two-component system LytT family response regulator